MNLDARVAEKILGWYRDSARRGPLSDWHEPKCGGSGRCAPSCGFTLRAYSTEIAAAFVVVEKMRESKWTAHITSNDQSPVWSVSFITRGTGGELITSKRESNSLPEAICRAALSAAAACVFALDHAVHRYKHGYNARKG